MTRVRTAAARLRQAATLLLDAAHLEAGNDDTRRQLARAALDARDAADALAPIVTALEQHRAAVRKARAA
jgi:hypothetical protein